MIRPLLAIVTLLAAASAAAGELILPVFAVNAAGPEGARRSTEVYLVNPEPEPVQVSVAGLLPGRIRGAAPCSTGAAQTRVVPPRSAVVWTASGLAADLGCADEIAGALLLSADGPVRIVGRVVRTPGVRGEVPSGALSGGGQEVEAIPVDDLPGPGTLLLPALLWHRNACGFTAFGSAVGFANPGPAAVSAVLDIPGETRRAIRVGGREVSLPHRLVVEPGRWAELELAPLDLPEETCLEPESFDLEVVVDGPVAVYGTVIDGWSLDGRTVGAVELR
ncbi:MAG: hypothetical protein MUC56_10460 [Thermoanaerobaculales bacterium]|jgi:hypothetical protein|nr:hypothetical protein [Thermoanaerobaculales bacterium]